MFKKIKYRYQEVENFENLIWKNFFSYTYLLKFTTIENV
jgi:hypothetical protein